MRKNLFIRSFRLIMVGILLTGAAAQAVVNWNGISITTNVIDDDINISGFNTVEEGITVRAQTVDIEATVSADAVLEGRLTGTILPRLYLIADAGRKITFSIDNNLQFSGDDDTTLLVVVGGAGIVEFDLGDGKKVEFTSNNTAHGGTEVFVMMDADTPSTLFFKRQTSGTAHVDVVVGPKSILSYIAQTAVSSGSANELGLIKFDTANSSSGRMTLRIKDTGVVYIGGNLYDFENPPPNLYLTDIDLKTPAGLEAQFIVENSVDLGVDANLLIINENTAFTSLLIDPWRITTSFDGVRHGFVLGANALLHVLGISYIDYVGLVNDACLSPDITASVLDGRAVRAVVKARNSSAFIVDGNSDAESKPAEIRLGDASAIVFRSGIDKDGVINWFNPDSTFSFTVVKAAQSAGEGNIVFDVEGLLNVRGDNTNNKLEVLSLQVAPTGGSVLIGGSETKFPLRTFAKDGAGDYYQYNAGAFLINNRMNLWSANLVHTDNIHNVYEKDDVRSEPTYVGGDTFELVGSPVKRPNIVFYMSKFYVHTNVAVTGLDLFAPNFSGNNTSQFLFFQNGIAHNNGTGRQMILGTQVGSTGCDSCCASISRDAHLDVFQDTYQVSTSAHVLTFTTQANDNTIVDSLPSGISDQNEIHTIYLGHSSNISIGTQGLTVDDPTLGAQPLTTSPTFRIDGNYFSFETRGGPQNSPELSAMSGKGGIFVDTNGLMTIGTGYRANISTMVVKSGNGIIDLPSDQVFFDNRVGISDWKLTLTASSQLDIVSTSESLSDYTLNWRDITHDYSAFTPYEVSTVNPCSCPAVVTANITGLPTVFGTVEQFQIKGSRIGSTAHLMVDDGWIRELVFLGGCESADAPTAVVVIKNDGRVGLGSKHRNMDSVSASVVMGVNGITIIADGSGRIDLNEDIIINNVCHILKGPNFSSGDRIQFHSDTARSMIVKAGGVLDLSSFSGANDIVEFAGDVNLILEPNSKIVLGGGVIHMTDHSRIEAVPVSDLAQYSFGTTVTSIDPIRVKLIGEGKISLDEDSVFLIGDDAYVGVETDSCYTNTTDLEIEIRLRGTMSVGDGSDTANSVFQVGNTVDTTGDSVKFKLNLTGVSSLFSIKSRGFVGLGVGMVDNNVFVAPDAWTIDTLFNTEHIEVLIPAGTFEHKGIFDSRDIHASLLAIINDSTPTFTFDYEGALGNTVQATIRGGGNMALVTPGSGAVQATVQTTDGVLSSRLTVGLFSSKAILDGKTALVNPTTGALLFAFWKTPDNNPVQTMYVNASQDEHNLLSVGYADGGFIERNLVDELIGQGGITVARKDFEHTLELGAIFADIGIGTAPRPVYSAFELP